MMGKIIASYSCPYLTHGTEFWEGVVQENMRLGKTREEAELFVNTFMTDPATVPA